MLESIVERMSLTAKKKNQTLTYHPINEVPVISGDHDGLERVIINIVSNAMKYTREGGTIEVYSSKVYKRHLYQRAITVSEYKKINFHTFSTVSIV